jgi:hypothetical protein
MTYDTKTIIDLAKTVLEALAYLLAGGFFLFRWTSGYLTTNLSLDITQSRQKSSESGKDRLLITVILTKGDSGSLHLFNIGMAVNGAHSDLIGQLSHYHVDPLDSWHRSIAWNEEKDERYVNFLNPGEKTQTSGVWDVASNEVAHIEVVVVGRRKWSHNLKQWRASAKSLPLPQA